MIKRSSLIENAEVARLLREMADLLELEEANPFRIRAYRNAARTVEEQANPVAEAEAADLDALPGIGPDLAGKIAEIVRTGTLAALAKVRKEVPAGLAELTRLRGLGPKRARALHESLGVDSLEALERAIADGRIRIVPGFGPKSEAKLKQELAARHGAAVRLPRAVAAEYADSLVRYLRSQRGVRQVEVAGSFRRRRDTVGDLDLLVICRTGTRVVDRFVRFAESVETLSQGETQASIRLRSGLQVDLRVLAEESFGAGLVYFTGSKAHNIALRRLGQRRGLKLNEYGVFRGNRRAAGRTEEAVYAAVGLPWIPPELREDRGEIDAAREGKLPDLVELRHLRGDVHTHTTDSDGRDDLEAMIAAARRLGHDYLGVADHSPALRMVRGLDPAGYRRQAERIDRLNAGLRGFTILKGAEVDIAGDGSLDLDDETLAALDLVIVAVHSKFDLSEREQTRRIVRAIRHPSVDILAHPSARLIGERQPIRFDAEQVFRAAADHGVMLEINAQPQRLDLDDVLARAAAEAGVRLIIGSDAHSTAELGFLKWGVDQARRGWLTAGDVANTRSLAQLAAMLHRTR